MPNPEIGPSQLYQELHALLLDSVSYSTSPVAGIPILTCPISPERGAPTTASRLIKFMDQLGISQTCQEITIPDHLALHQPEPRIGQVFVAITPDKKQIYLTTRNGIRRLDGVTEILDLDTNKLSLQNNLGIKIAYPPSEEGMTSEERLIYLFMGI